MKAFKIILLLLIIALSTQVNSKSKVKSQTSKGGFGSAFRGLFKAAKSAYSIVNSVSSFFRFFVQVNHQQINLIQVNQQLKSLTYSKSQWKTRKYFGWIKRGISAGVGFAQSFNFKKAGNARNWLKGLGGAFKGFFKRFAQISSESSSFNSKWRKASKNARFAQKYAKNVAKCKRSLRLRRNKIPRKFRHNKKLRGSNWLIWSLKYGRRKIQRKYKLSHKKYRKLMRKYLKRARKHGKLGRVLRRASKVFRKVQVKRFAQVKVVAKGIKHYFKSQASRVLAAKTAYAALQVSGFGTNSLSKSGFKGIKKELKRQGAGKPVHFGNVLNTPFVRSVKTLPSSAKTLARLLTVQKKELKVQKKIAKKG